MRRFFILTMALGLAAGCVSKRKAAMEQQQAYIAGERQVMRSQAAQKQGPVVYFQGPVRNSTVPWREGLMLSQAIVDADYTGFMNPLVVRVIRHGQVVTEMKGIDLLHHDDAPLEDGDLVQIIE